MFDKLKSSWWSTYAKETGFALHHVATEATTSRENSSSSRKSSAAKKSRGMKLKPSRAVGGSAPASKRITSSVGSLSGDDSSDGGAVLLWKTSLDLRRSSDSSSSSSTSGDSSSSVSESDIPQKIKRSTRGKPRAKKRTKN